MKKMIVVALAFVAFNANSQIAPIAPSLSPSLVDRHHDIACASNDEDATNKCIEVSNEQDVEQQLSVDKMTPKQRTMLLNMARQIIKDEQTRKDHQ
jgi:hypothetical protein